MKILQIILLSLTYLSQVNSLDVNLSPIRDTDFSELNLTIPKKIWQTTISHKLGNDQRLQALDWLIYNPDYEYNLINDYELNEFFKQNFNKDIYEMVNKYPLGVMKADFWRYSVMYQYGGIYADIDVTPLMPVEQWKFNPIQNYAVVIGIEYIISDENYLKRFNQWTLMSSPKHPLFKAVIERIFEFYLSQNKEIKTFDNFVHKYTGPLVFSEGIFKFFNLTFDMYSDDLMHNAQYLLKQQDVEGSEIYAICKKYKIKFVDNFYFQLNFTQNLFGSQNFKDDNFVRWIDQQKSLLKNEKIEHKIQPLSRSEENEYLQEKNKILYFWKQEKVYIKEFQNSLNFKQNLIYSLVAVIGFLLFIIILIQYKARQNKIYRDYKKTSQHEMQNIE